MTELPDKITALTLVYVASPYSSGKGAMDKHSNHHAVAEFISGALHPFTTLYSPILHNHYMADKFSLEHGWEFWQSHDKKMISLADEVWVVKLPGWDTSLGVTAEIEFAKKLGKAVFYHEA